MKRGFCINIFFAESAPRVGRRLMSMSANYTGRNLLGLSDKFAKLRILLVFDQADCTLEERAQAGNLHNILSIVFGNNMDMNNFEVVYTCKKISDGTGTMGLMNYFALGRSALQSTRETLGGDILITVGKFVPLVAGSPASGDMGPLKDQIICASRDSLFDLMILPHEMGHNFGMNHDRFSDYNNQGQYTCNTDASKCSFGYEDNDHYTIMSCMYSAVGFL
jgi:hypothetical protein